MTMWRNPVLVKELRLALRHGRSFLVLAVYVAALSAVIAFVYPREEIALVETSAHIGRRIFEAFTRAQFVLVLLLVPALTAPMLTVEKEKQTLESLLVSGLTPYQIVLGKFYYSLFHVSLLIVASVPLTAVSFMLGGVSPLELAQAYGLTFALAVGLMLMSLVVSAAVSRSHVAVMVTYGLTTMGGIIVYALNALKDTGIVLLVLLAVGTAAGVAWIVWYDFARRCLPSRLQMTFPHWFRRWLNLYAGSLIVMGMGSLPLDVIHADVFHVRLDQFLLASFPFAAITTLSLLVVPLGIAAALLARPVSPRVPLRHRWEAGVESWGSRRQARTTGSGRRGKLRPTYGLKPFIADKANPVLARELRGSLFGRRDQFIRALFLATFVTELALIGVFGLTDRSPTLWLQLLRWYCVGNVVAVFAVGALLGALTFSMEREQRSLDLLLVTPLSSRQMVFGKYTATCYFTGYLVVASLPVTGFSCVFGFIPLEAVLLMTAGLIVWGAWAASIGVCCSIVFRRARQAVGAALGVVLLLVGSSALVEILAPSVLVTSRFGFYLRYPALALLPVYVTRHFMAEFTRTLSLSSFLAADWQSMASYTYLVPLWETLVCNIMTYAVSAVLLRGIMAWLFEWRVRQRNG